MSERCPICELKWMNCDCTDGDRRAYELEQENEEMSENRLDPEVEIEAYKKDLIEKAIKAAYERGLKDGAPKWVSAKTPPTESGSYLTCSSWDTEGANACCLPWSAEHQAWNYPHTIHNVGWWMPPIAPTKGEE